MDELEIHASTTRARHPPDQPINLVIDGLRDLGLQDRSDRTDDLIRIGAYVYRADQLVSRGGPTDAHDDLWQREFALCIPVVDVTFWSRSDVLSLLTAALGFGTGDVWQFAFSAAPAGVHGHVAVQQTLDGILLSEKPGCVVLFSGGLDSLSALIDARNRGERPVAVGHWSAPPIKARQTRLLNELTRIPTDLATIPLVGAWIHGYGIEAKERTRRARGFLFACLAGAVAGELGIHRVYLADNGPISLNLPINAQITGAHVSRSTHPVFLATLTQLMALVYEAAPVFSNPLEYQTRVDCLQTIDRAGLASLIPMTNSCASWGRLPDQTPHCGICSQCIDRRFSMIAAELTAFDPVDQYKIDLFRDHLAHWQAQVLALSYVRFAQKIVRMSPNELLREFPQIYDAILPHDPDPDTTCDAYVDLLQRHARGVVNALTSEIAGAAADIAAGRMLSSALILIAGFHGEQSIEGASSTPSDALMPRSIFSMPAAEQRASGIADRVDTEQIFAFDGARWHLTYEARSIQLPDQKGLIRIAYLLDHPWTDYTGGELLIATDPTMHAAVWSAAQARDNGLVPLSFEDGGALGDATYKRQLQDKTQELLRDIDRARDAGDEQWIADLNEQIEVLANAVSKTWGLGGRERGFGNTVTQQRESVKRSINRALVSIDPKHPKLAAHLRAALKRSTVFAYRPDRGISWQVTFPDIAA